MSETTPSLLKMSIFSRLLPFLRRHKPSRAKPENTPEVWLILSEKIWALVHFIRRLQDYAEPEDSGSSVEAKEVSP